MFTDFRERGKREGETYLVPTIQTLTEDQTRSLGMFPDREMEPATKKSTASLCQ